MKILTDQFDLAALSRSQLKQLAALELQIRSLIEDAGFDPNEVSFGKTRKRDGARQTRKNGDDAND